MATLQAKLKLLMGLLRGSRAYTPPFFIDLDLTNYCNFKCLDCPYHSPALVDSSQKPEAMNFDMIRRLAEELNPHETPSIILQGAGEPLLYPQILEVVELFKQKGFLITLLTNGFLLNSKLSTELLRAGLDILKISLWASSPAQYALNYPSSPLDNYFRVLENMTRIAEMKRVKQLFKPQLYWHHPFNCHNSSTLDTLIGAVQKAGCNGMSFSPVSMVRAKHRDSALEGAPLAALKAELKKRRPQLEAAGLEHNIPETLLRYDLGEAVWQQLPCYMGWVHARFRVDGTLQPCGRCELSFGTLKEKRLAELWNGPEIQEFRRVARTSPGLSNLGTQCDCNYCCFAPLNWQIHRYYQWFNSPGQIVRRLLTPASPRREDLASRPEN